MSPRRRQHGLERVLGTRALFSTAYGDVGSSIYYALGLTASFALGLTPVVFVIAGLFFIATALTYAEGTVRFPEAGGSSSFARHAFNEVFSFGAAWAQMLNYLVTISISAFFVPHYLSVFWGPLRTNPWDIVGGAAVIAILVALNVFGIREATRLNVVLALVDFSTQVLLVLLGAALIFNPHVLAANVHFGLAPRWSAFFLGIPIAMIAYTGMETISNLAEETRDPARDVPRAYKFVAGAVFTIYLTLPAIALMALPVHRVGGRYQTLLGQNAPRGYAGDPVLGIVNNLGLHGFLLTALRYYVGVLAGTILIIAANAGVMGSSRITYAMASHRQLPERLRRLHPRFKTPWLSLILFSGLLATLTLLPGRIDFLGTMYSFGAMLSFAMANAAIIGLRVRYPREELRIKSRPNLRLRGIDWPLFAIVGLLGTSSAWMVVVIQRPTTRWVGMAWLVIGFAVYVVYRKLVLHAPLRQTLRAPAEILPWRLEYRCIVVPLVGDAVPVRALHAASRLAAERRSRLVLLAPLEVPLGMALGTTLLDEQERRLEDLLDESAAIAGSYGVRTVPRLVRTRSAAGEILAEAGRQDAEIVILEAQTRPRRRSQRLPLEEIVEQVVKRATCRVMLVSGPSPQPRRLQPSWQPPASEPAELEAASGPPLEPPLAVARR
jgi:APA family basic amino acid/polyamine antiporter